MHWIYDAEGGLVCLETGARVTVFKYNTRVLYLPAQPGEQNVVLFESERRDELQNYIVKLGTRLGAVCP